MKRIDHKKSAFIVSVLVLVVTILHYGTHLALHHYHIFYRQLYFIPIIIAGFRFGIRGALVTSIIITVLYTPFITMYWDGFSPDDFAQIMEVILYNVVAIVVGALRDRERAEQLRLRQAESLAAMGKAVSCLAHDMKTPLIAIGGFTRLVQKELHKDSPGYDRLEIVIRETKRMEEAIRDMLDFARPAELHRCIEDINQMVLEVISIVETEAKERNVTVESRLDTGLPPVALDSMKMERAILNLVMNAIQASPPGETITVRTSGNGGAIVVEVVDHGSGIPHDQREQIFTPFFTTKKEGTGLGLCIAKKLIEAHGGNIRILDNPDSGVTFRITLPLNCVGQVMQRAVRPSMAMPARERSIQ